MFYLDFFAVQAGDPIYVEDVILDAGSQFQFQGTWQTTNFTGAYGDGRSTFQTPVGGGSTSLGFHGMLPLSSDGTVPVLMLFKGPTSQCTVRSTERTTQMRL